MVDALVFILVALCLSPEGLGRLRGMDGMESRLSKTKRKRNYISDNGKYHKAANDDNSKWKGKKRNSSVSHCTLIEC